MGWNGGGPLFDGMVRLVLERCESLEPAVIQDVVMDVYELFEDTDWDTQDESEFFIPYLLEVMHESGEVDDEYYQEAQESLA